MDFRVMMTAVEDGRILGPIERQFSVDFKVEPWDAQVAVNETQKELLEMIKEIILLSLTADGGSLPKVQA